MKQNVFARVLCIALALMTVGSMTLIGFQMFSADAAATPTANGSGVITDDYVNLRSGAGTNYSVVTNMSKNTKVTFIDGKLYSTNWYKIKELKTNKTGYVHKNYVKATETASSSASSTSGYINADYVNLRKGAGTNYAVVTTMRVNTKLTLVSTKLYNSSWYNVKLSNGQTGYVMKTYVTLNAASTTKATQKATQATTPKPTQQATQATKATETTKPATAQTGYINADYVNLRKGAGTNYAVVTTMRINTAFTFISTNLYNSSWYNVKLSDGKTGYVIKDYVTKDSGNTDNNSSTKPAENNTAPSAGTVTLSVSSRTIYVGNKFAVTAKGASNVKWTSSKTSVATVDSNGVVTAKASGTTTIKAASSTSSASCTITVVSGSSVHISQTSISNMRCGKSVLLTSNTSGVSWSTSNSAIATVKNGVVTTKGNGYVTITASNGYGAATCLIRVIGRDNIRFVYASPNSAPKNTAVTFKAITDTDRVAVRFVVSKDSKSYTIEANNKTKEGNTLVWTGSYKLDEAGTWKVKAYAKYKTSTSYLTTAVNGESEVFVTNATNTTATVTGTRRASDEVIKIISEFEGFLPEITPDSITGDPTIGHGKVIFSNEQFYNNLTRSEAYAYLVQTVNTGAYTERTNSFLTSNDIKFNQQQFDALVCFAYNVGAYALTNDSTLSSVLLNTYSGTSSVKAGGSGYVNASAVNLRSGAGTNYSIVTNMAQNTSFTFVDGKLYNSAWYKIKLSNGKTGYIYSIYASSTGGTRDLNKIDKNTFINRFLQYHHASGDCWWGLLYRRVDEVEMFLYGDYELDGSRNKYHFEYYCGSYSRISIS